MDKPVLPAGLAYRDALLKRLIEHFLTGEGEASRHTPLTVPTLTLFHHLYYYVVIEGYGE